MALFSKKQAAFLAYYGQQAPAFTRAAGKAKEIIGAVLDAKGIVVHTIEARAKDLKSLRRKIFQKSYKDPAKETTDLIGIRVITFYEEDSRRAADALREAFEIDDKLSVNKSAGLGTSEFGYRSVHLIASLNGSRTNTPEYSDLRKHKFEIQVRTVLDHVWAEIEHEVVYKTGVVYPEETDRRFASLAGTLEILGREFSSLRKEKDALIEALVGRLRSNFSPRMELTVISLAALLIVDRPKAQRFSDTRGLPTGIESLCVDALRKCGIKRLSDLRSQLRSARLRKLIQRYAVNRSEIPESVSDFGVILLLLRGRHPQLITELFPEYQADIGLIA